MRRHRPRGRDGARWGGGAPCRPRAPLRAPSASRRRRARPDPARPRPLTSGRAAKTREGGGGGGGCPVSAERRPRPPRVPSQGREGPAGRAPGSSPRLALRGLAVRRPFRARGRPEGTAGRRGRAEGPEPDCGVGVRAAFRRSVPVCGALLPVRSGRCCCCPALSGLGKGILELRRSDSAGRL